MKFDSAPRIALTLSRITERNREFIARYRVALEHAGAEVTEVYPTDPLFEDFDGVLLGGGGDIDPARYGAPNEGSVNIDPERDELELRLAALAVSRDVPVLGVCRGMQLLNVVRGGSLVQHVEGHSSGKSEQPVVHDLRPRAGSRLAASARGEALRVNSHHHQAVTPESLGSGLQPTATTADGSIEAFEATDQRWVVGVQWHPEQTHEVPPAVARIIDDFVAAARDAAANDETAPERAAAVAS